MKKFVLFGFAAGLMLFGCKKETIQATQDQLDPTFKNDGKVNICHVDDYGNHFVLNITSLYLFLSLNSIHLSITSPFLILILILVKKFREKVYMNKIQENRSQTRTQSLLICHHKMVSFTKKINFTQTVNKVGRTISGWLGAELKMNINAEF